MRISFLFLMYLFSLFFPTATVYSESDIPYAVDNSFHSRAYLALSPYYVKQENESSCSLATVTMMVNALLSQTSHSFAPQTQAQVLARVHDKNWAKAVSPGGPGICLDQCLRILKKAFLAYGLQNINIDIHHVSHPRSSSPQLRKDLYSLASKKKLTTLLIANFDQSILIPIQTPVGHFSPLGDFSHVTQKVLVMDVDKEWTGPYWVGKTRLLKSLHTIDSDCRKYRGYIAIRIHHKIGKKTARWR